jgi:hypothetical protein
VRPFTLLDGTSTASTSVASSISSCLPKVELSPTSLKNVCLQWSLSTAADLMLESKENSNLNGARKSTFSLVEVSARNSLCS